MKRITPNKITSLKKDEIFVFGSNLAGLHGAGAAKQALNWGARMGIGEGLQGQTYGLPTKDEYLRTLSVSRIKLYVEKFLRFAMEHPNLHFLVTEVGCGLAGYSIEEIAPLFNDAKQLTNISLPESFLETKRNLSR